MHSATLEKTRREGGKPTKSPNIEHCKFIDSKSTKSWCPGLSVANSPPALPILIFCNHRTCLGVGRAHMVWGRGPGELMWVAEDLTKNSVAGPVIFHQISGLLYRINVSLCERQNRTFLFSQKNQTPTIHTHSIYPYRWAH